MKSHETQQNAQESMKVSGDDLFETLFETQIQLHKDQWGVLGRC